MTLWWTGQFVLHSKLIVHYWIALKKTLQFQHSLLEIKWLRLSDLSSYNICFSNKCLFKGDFNKNSSQGSQRRTLNLVLAARILHDRNPVQIKRIAVMKFKIRLQVFRRLIPFDNETFIPNAYPALFLRNHRNWKKYWINLSEIC